MLEPRQHPGPVEREQVAQSLRDLRTARARVATARHDPGLRWKTDALRAELLSALESYAAAIAGIGAPVPNRVRLEITLYRELTCRS